MAEKNLPQSLQNEQVARTPLSSVVSIEQQRAIQEVQGMMIMAKKFPRNEADIEEKIKKACQRKSLAEEARYVYPRGDTTVQGPSIRLAEAIARLWGNMLYGIQELSRSPGHSEMEAYAWDLESNTRRSIKFQVDHIRWTKKGSYDLKDPRDIYEMTANMGARRVRACIQGIIPADIFDIAEEECEKTVAAALEGKTEDIIKVMVAKYDEIGVKVAALEKRLGHKIEATINQEIIVLRKIFVSIRDGMGKKEDYFESSVEQKSKDKEAALTEKLAGEQGKQTGTATDPTIGDTRAKTESDPVSPPIAEQPPGKQRSPAVVVAQAPPFTPGEAHPVVIPDGQDSVDLDIPLFEPPDMPGPGVPDPPAVAPPPPPQKVNEFRLPEGKTKKDYVKERGGKNGMVLDCPPGGWKPNMRVTEKFCRGMCDHYEAKKCPMYLPDPSETDGAKK